MAAGAIVQVPGRCPVVPHVVRPCEPCGADLRAALGIPPDATVFGRHGGYHTFDISFVHAAVREVAERRPDIFFVFLNTAPFLHSATSDAPAAADAAALLPPVAPRGDEDTIDVSERDVANSLDAAQPAQPADGVADGGEGSLDALPNVIHLPGPLIDEGEKAALHVCSGSKPLHCTHLLDWPRRRR